MTYATPQAGRKFRYTPCVPYERFCDIHVTAGLKYHFTPEIVAYCKYQVETKAQNVVAGNSLIVLDYIANWQATAFTLLKEFQHGRIAFVDGNNAAGSKIKDLWVKEKENSQKRIGVDAQSGAVGKIVKKFYEEKVADPATEGFKGFVVRPLASGGGTLSRPGPGNENPTIAFSSSRNVELLDERVGYLAVSIPMDDIAKAVASPNTRKIIEWVIAKPSKLRFTAHGDGEGNLEMQGNNDHGSTDESMSAECVAKWLHANGLVRRGELKTISLNLCMAAKHNLTPAVLKNGKYTPAEGSAVDLLARKLTSLQVTGVKVTGSSDVVDAKTKEGFARTPIKDVLRNNQSFRQISIPTGFPFDSATLTITVPDGWSITQKRMSDSQLCVLKPPSNWTVIIAPRKMDGSDAAGGSLSKRQTWQADGSKRETTIVSDGYIFKSPDGKTSYTVKNDGWIVTQSTKEALSTEGWTWVDNHNMRFTGTGGASALEANGNERKIVERIAKSNAKAVAYS